MTSEHRNSSSSPTEKKISIVYTLLSVLRGVICMEGFLWAFFFNSWKKNKKVHLAQALFSVLFYTLTFTFDSNIFTYIISRPIKSMIISLPSNYMVASFNLVPFTLSEFLTFNSCSTCIFITFLLLLPGMKGIQLCSRH